MSTVLAILAAILALWKGQEALVSDHDEIDWSLPSPILILVILTYEYWLKLSDNKNGHADYTQNQAAWGLYPSCSTYPHFLLIELVFASLTWYSRAICKDIHRLHLPIVQLCILENMISSRYIILIGTCKRRGATWLMIDILFWVTVENTLVALWPPANRVWVRGVKDRTIEKALK